MGDSTTIPVCTAGCIGAAGPAPGEDARIVDGLNLASFNEDIIETIIITNSFKYL